MASLHPTPTKALVWLRRDLRCSDHAALYHALRQFDQVYCAFVFDTDILDALPQRHDRRVQFIHASLLQLHAGLQAMGERSGAPHAGLIVRHGQARQCIPQLAQALGVQHVLVNRDYEPQALARDQAVQQALHACGIGWSDYKDQVLLDRSEVLNQQGKPYSVFTPYKRAWLQKLDAFQRQSYPVERYAHRLAPLPQPVQIPSLAQLGFAATPLPELLLPAGMQGAQQLLQDFLPRMAHYHTARDYPAQPGTSQLSVHLRFGTLSIRQLAQHAHAAAQQGSEGAQTWLSELCWRDFYCMILWHHPHVVTHAFRPDYERVQWEDDPELLAAWSAGRTGYPLVDAGMRQLLQTGYMHNRLRMVVASFLTKSLGIDWRAGERFFAQHLNDYDLASNNGGWQWAASTGCDAQPWFRIFNPITQSQRFDAEGDFIRRYVPELQQLPAQHIHFPAALSAQRLAAYGLQLGVDYPHPIVNHATARERTLMRFHFLRPAAH